MVFKNIFERKIILPDGKIQKLKLHHPSSEKEYEWPNFEIDRENFLHSFSTAENIIVFQKR